MGVNATWKKVKHHAISQYNKSSNSSSTTASTKENNKQNVLNKIKFGNNGEVILVFNNSIEIWDWKPNCCQLYQQDLGIKKTNNSSNEDYSNKDLYLVSSFNDLPNNCKIIETSPILCEQETNHYLFLIVIKLNNELKFLIRNFGQYSTSDEYNTLISDQQLILPPAINGEPITIRTSMNFIIIGTNANDLSIFKINDDYLQNIDNLKVEIKNNECLFDLNDSILTYVEYNEVKRDSQKVKLTNMEFNQSFNDYKNFFELISKSTIDSLFDYDIENPNFRQVIRNFLNSFKPSELVIKIVNLRNNKIKEIGIFQPNNGVSKLSLSPFDSQLITVSNRGDEIYKWDLTKLPIEIKLIDYQIRGKTSNIVQDIHWFNNDLVLVSTKSSGTVHFFNFNNKNLNWLLPNINCVRIGSCGDGCILLVIEENELLMGDLNGVIEYKYELPTSCIPKSLLPAYLSNGEFLEDLIVERNETTKQKINSLSQIEIETCERDYSTFLKNKNIVIKSVKYGDNRQDAFNFFDEKVFEETPVIFQYFSPRLTQTSDELMKDLHLLSL